MKISRIHQLPAADRPREKLKHKGVAALSTFELIEAILGTGSGTSNVGNIAMQIQRLLAKVGLAGITYDALVGLKGVNEATACKLLAALELAKRQLAWDAEPLTTMHDILARLQDIRNKNQEYLVCLSLDGANRLIARRIIGVGTLETVIAHPREIFADAIADRAASIIVAHNHPSGDIRPSQKDITLTQRLQAAGLLIGVRLQDHIIVTKTESFSFSQHHLIY